MPEGTGYDARQYTFQNYQNVLSSSDYARFQQLNAQWNALFPSFQNFDYNAVINNPQVAQAIQRNISERPSGDIDNRAAKQQVFQQMMDFFGKATGATGKIFPKIGDEEIRALYDPLRGGVNELAGQARRQVAGDINRASAGATERATEGLAGTGLGRSGVAARQFSGIEEQRALQTSGALERVESARMQQQLQIDQAEQNFRIQQELSEQGFDIDSIRAEQAFNYQLMAMNFEAALQYDPGSWLDNFGDIVDIGVGLTQIGLAIFGGPPGAAAAAGIEGVKQ